MGLAGSRIRASLILPNFNIRIEVGRAPCGASKSKKRTVRIRSLPSLKDFLVVLSVV